MGLEFVFQSFKDMKTSLGKYDAYIEVNEVALRHFLKEAERKEDPAVYVEKMAREVGINVRSDSFLETLHRMSGLYILSVYQAFEVFLGDYKEEFKGYWDTWTPKEDGETLISNTLKNIKGLPNGSSKAIGPEHLAVVEYYRVVRNHFMHNDDKSKKLVDQGFSKIGIYQEKIQSFYKTRSSPSSYNQLNVDDFFLFTKSAKEIGLQLSRLGAPSEEKISDLIAKPKFSKFKNNAKRLESALILEAQSRFNIDIKESRILKLALKKVMTC
ncbi:MAG: hypothetical protein KF767_11690 [Bdellovibrionaceae bacterium]|nr:hypothetical protein [Pseudobdellovibrionaceae bacterium]